MNIQKDKVAAELTFADILRVLTQYRAVLVTVWVLCIALALAAALLSKPVFRAETQVAAAGEGASSGGDLSSLISRFSSVPGMGRIGRLSQRDTLTESMVTLRSPTFLMSFVRDKNIKPFLFEHLWDAENKQWNVASEEEIPSDMDAYMLFREQLLRVAENKTTPGIVSIAVEWRDRQQAASWVNSLVNKLNQRMREAAIDEANKTIEYLNKELEKARIVEVRQAIYFMIENQINLRTMANVREEYALKVLSEAVVPDADHYVSPNRRFMVVIGFITGFILGVFACFLLFAIKRWRAAKAGESAGY